MNTLIAYMSIVTIAPFTELLCYDAVFIYTFKRKNKFALRFVLYYAGCVAMFALVGWGVAALCAYVWAFAVENIEWMGILLNFLLFGCNIGYFFVCFDEKPLTLLYAAVGGKAAYEIYNCLYSLLLMSTDSRTLYVFLLDKPDAWSVCFFFLSHAAVLLSCYFAFARSFARAKREFDGRLGVYVLIMFFVIVGVAMFVRSNAVLGTENKSVIAVFNAVMMLFCLTVLLVERFMLYWINDREAKAAAENLYEGYKRRAEFTKESIRLVNIKCHDLKHQIRDMLAGRVDDGYLEEVNKTIAIYDADIRTGNDALDVILTEKSLRCEVDGVKLTVMVDGGAMSFMSVSDVNSFFGNAIDNAIERELCEQEGNRFIRLSSARCAGLFTVRVENYCSAEVALDKSGLPETTKQNKADHGFGVKSIRDVARKYGGEVNFGTEDGLFVLSAVFPVKQ